MIAGNMTQANSAADVLEANFGIPPLATGLVMASLIGIVLLGGIKRIGGVAGRLVPFMVVVYAIGVLTLLFMYIDALPSVIQLIFTSAFNPQAAIGGFAGASVSDAISFGASRGVFSNEAGLGSAPIAHAAAKTNEPVREGLVAMMEPLIDTLCINTMTAFAILVTGAWTTGESGAELTSIAFGRGMPGVGGILVAIAITMFAFSTTLTQGYYGNRAVDFLWGEKAASIYRWIFVGMHVVGAVITLQLVWTLADIANGLLALPNLLTLIIMSGSIALWVKEYFSRPQIPYAEFKNQEETAGSDG
jgi:AGCS family alanine or glycine:cation symporter